MLDIELIPDLADSNCPKDGCNGVLGSRIDSDRGGQEICLASTHLRVYE